MKLKKNIRQYIKIALSAGLLAFPSCNYLDCLLYTSDAADEL